MVDLEPLYLILDLLRPKEGSSLRGQTISNLVTVMEEWNLDWTKVVNSKNFGPLFLSDVDISELKFMHLNLEYLHSNLFSLRDAISAPLVHASNRSKFSLANSFIDKIKFERIGSGPIIDLCNSRSQQLNINCVYINELGLDSCNIDHIIIIDSNISIFNSTFLNAETVSMRDVGLYRGQLNLGGVKVAKFTNCTISNMMIIINNDHANNNQVSFRGCGFSSCKFVAGFGQNISFDDNCTFDNNCTFKNNCSGLP